MAHLEDELGDIVSKARKGRGISAEQLAELCGISVREIEQMESYKFTPDRDCLVKIAGALALAPDKLIEIAEGAWEPPPVVLPQDKIIIKSLRVPMGGYEENAYIFACAETRAAAVVDPGGVPDQFMKLLAEQNLSLDLALITHAHGDHIGGLRELARVHPTMRLINHQLERDSVIRGLSNRWEPAKDGIPIRLGNLAITPLFTPGHTPGSTCYQIDGTCFVGDTIFAGSIGRPGSREIYSQMLNDIKSKVLSLPDKTVLLPGHGPASTVSEEKKHNPFF